MLLGHGFTFESIDTYLCCSCFFMSNLLLFSYYSGLGSLHSVLFFLEHTRELCIIILRRNNEKGTIQTRHTHSHHCVFILYFSYLYLSFLCTSIDSWYGIYSFKTVWLFISIFWEIHHLFFDIWHRLVQNWTNNQHEILKNGGNIG
jgi:hypothetical protein